MIINEYLFIPPDWKSSLNYRRRWFTNIISSIDNTEQRSQLFTWPRRSLTFSILTSGYFESMYLKERLYKNLHNVWGVPFWQDETYLDAVAPEGQKNLSLDTRWRNFEVGGCCVLYSSPISWEVGIIDSLNISSITLNQNLISTWQKGTRVYPILAGRIRNELPVNLHTATISETRLEIIEEFDSEIIRQIGNYSGYPTFKGIPLFNKTPNWGETIELRFIHPYQHLTYLGKSISFSHFIETELGLKANYLIHSKAEIKEILDFFDGCSGRRRNFWYPSNQQDIKIIAPFLASDTQLTIENIQFQTYWLFKKAGANLKIDWPDGSYVCVGISDFIAPNTLILETPVGKQGNASQLERITASFLYFSRFTQDEIEIEYQTDEIGKIQLSIQTNFKDAPGS